MSCLHKKLTYRHLIRILTPHVIILNAIAVMKARACVFLIAINAVLKVGALLAICTLGSVNTCVNVKFQHLDAIDKVISNSNCCLGSFYY